VATHLQPEILVIDEVLAVGDTEFEKKCLGKMGEIAQGGRTVLFVSHNMNAVERLCRRVIQLERGRVAGVYDDPTRSYRLTAPNGLILMPFQPTRAHC
jgi:lipopolysaccharide transport system ATP-binding protein